MIFENGGLDTEPVHGHTYLHLTKGYSWLFTGVEKELIRLGYTVGYESGFIGKDSGDKSVKMSIEIFLGHEDSDEVVEASFDLTIAEVEPDRGRLSYAPMPGGVEVPGLDFRDREGFEACASEPSAAVIARVTDDIHEMAQRMISAYRDAR